MSKILYIYIKYRFDVFLKCLVLKFINFINIFLSIKVGIKMLFVIKSLKSFESKRLKKYYCK